MVICCIFAYSQKENFSLLDFCPMYKKKSILFVLNPKSGVHNKSALPKLIENYIDKSKFEYAIVETKYKGHASKLASEAVAEKVDIVVAVGGDGTVNEIGCSLVGTDTALGILPCGSGNGLARHLGIPLVLKNAIEYINKAAVVSVDYGKINGTPFFCTCGIGYDAFVSETFSKGKRRGLVGYANNALQALVDYEPELYEIETEWSSKHYEAFLIAFGNAAQYGNNACIAPQASMRDGMLSVTVLKPFSVVEIPVILGQLFSSHLYNNERIETINARWVKIKRKKPGVVHFDGEPMMMSNELMVEIVPSGLNVLALPEWDGRGANISLFRQGFDMLRASVDSDIIPHLETLSHLHNIPEFFKRDTKE